MVVTWVTFEDPGSSFVKYGAGKGTFSKSAKGTTNTFTENGWKENGGMVKRTIIIHTATMTDLQPGSKYGYNVGSSYGRSQIHTFSAIQSGTNWSPRFAVYGDMGYKDGWSLPRLKEDTLNGKYDAILHVGDFAYSLFMDGGRVGDKFMRQLEPVAASVPYMTCVGNHEMPFNFSSYKARFKMPKAGGDGQNMYYSFNIGPVHIIAYNSESYYFKHYGTQILHNQFKWLEKDLKEANKPKNRAARPWIVTIGHRPMYCSNMDDEHCTTTENSIRVGLPGSHKLGLEDLFYKYGVDLNFQGHEHCYERFWPIYDGKGSAEGKDDFLDNPHSYSAFRNNDFGYTRMNVINSTHLYIEQVPHDKNMKIIDQMMLIKEKHGPGLYTCHLKKNKS